ncbi:MAG: indole-3-glycerol phosphate synthase TrpC [Candidatus Rokubacteria bacterium]|nr:indole-3-glycerol phosphate synthase TrpC [Candidatus Rokubacteria bacterium]
MGVLDQIVRDKRDEVVRRKREISRGELEARGKNLSRARSFRAALHPLPLPSLRPGARRVRLIAEIKNASPSRGVFTESFDPVALAGTYSAHGASALSVLTDEKYFRGSREHLERVRAAVDLPLLRKDFMLDEYQLWESRALGADAVLLIVAALDRPLLQDLHQAAGGIGLDALVEVHTPHELDAALSLGASLIGINNRNLQTLETSLEISLELIPRIPPGPVVVSESGLFTRDDVERVVAAGAHAVLVGEALVTASDVAAKVRELALLEDPA